ncbi:MAG TPA: hypothetical protein VFM20_00875 [Nitrososphaeraceae archaeon]|nr:hypothetical protein [Nitrososphaeraceae archaeon]
MDLTNRKFTCFSILIISVSFVFAQGISSNYLISSAEGSQNKMNLPKVIPIQGNSEDGEESEDSQSSDNLLGNSNEVGSNETGGPSNGHTGGESFSGNTNQSESDVTIDQALDENTNQTLESESQVNQNVNQTTNQNVNVNQTNNQNVNVNVEMKQRLDLKISEEEGEAPITIEEQTRIESDDKIIVTEHTVISGPECKAGNVLDGASNAEDLRVLAECQDAIGTVMHTKKMDDGDYKFFLNVEEPFKFLVNDKNNDETEGFLVVEIVPPHQDGIYLPKDGDRVHVWGAWVTDKPKGWHEIHPTWNVVKM